MDTSIELGNINLKAIKLIGKGAFGSVILCSRRISNNSTNINNINTTSTLNSNNHNHEFVCTKQIKINNIHNANELKMIRSEIYIISQLKHPRIIQFFEYYFHQNTVNIIMEYAEHGTLREYLKNRNRWLLTTTIIRQIFCDILMGLEYLHIRGVIHRDLKPDNVLMDTNGRPKISDFGISFIHVDILSETICALGTPLYIAPEVLNGQNCDYRADIWALGCILYELCTFDNPFQHVKNIQQLNSILLNPKHIFVNCINIPHTTNGIRKICELMLTFNPNHRISIASIIKNPWLAIYYYKLYFNYNS